MKQGYPTYSKAAQKGEAGIDLASRIVNKELGWLLVRNHQEHDFGIDAQVDIILDDGSVTGQIIAMQIKYGKSFFQEKNQWGYVYRGDQKHFNYLANYPTPVLIYTGEYSHSLKTIALCLTEIKIISKIPKKYGQIHVNFSTDKIAEFLDSHFPGLNEMTEWLSMPLDENKRSSYEIANALGLNLLGCRGRHLAQAQRGGRHVGRVNLQSGRTTRQ